MYSQRWKDRFPLDATQERQVVSAQAFHRGSQPLIARKLEHLFFANV